MTRTTQRIVAAAHIAMAIGCILGSRASAQIVDVREFVDSTITEWRLDRQTGLLEGTLRISNQTGSGRSVLGEFWFTAPHQPTVYLWDPDGTLADNVDYVDITADVVAALPQVGNGNTSLDPGESVDVRYVVYYSRDRSPPQGAVYGVSSRIIGGVDDFYIEEIFLEEGLVYLRLTNLVDGLTYSIEAATDIEQKDWQNLDVFVAPSNTLLWADTFSINAVCYRVVVGDTSGQVVFRAIPSCEPTSGNAPLRVRFRGLGEYSEGSIERYRWDFEGDGIFNTSEAVSSDHFHTFSQSGTYDAVLEVMNNDGEVTVAICTISVGNSPPAVSANAVPSNGSVPLDVSFSVSASDADGSIVLYEWDFEGDGTYDHSSPASGNTLHTYASIGMFQATVRVTDNGGASTIATAATTVIRPAPPGSPSVTATAGPTSGSAPLNVSLGGSAADDGTIVLWEWDFDGDGTYDYSNAASPGTSHTYAEAGIFAAALRATDNDGNTGVDNVVVSSLLQASLSISDDTFDPGMGETAIVDTSLNAPSAVKVLVNDRAGQTRRTLVNASRPAGAYADPWDGLDDAGQPLPQGDYYAILEYQDQGQTKTLDLSTTTGGSRYNPSRSSLPSQFRPFEDDMLDIHFTVPSSRGASEVQVFIGLFNVDTRWITLLDRDPFGVGSYTVHWNGLDSQNQLATPPPGDKFLLGLWGWTLPDNAVMLQTAPTLSNVSVDPNFFDPTTGDLLTPSNPVARVTFDLDESADVTLTATNLKTGKDLKTVTQLNVPAGAGHTIEWDGHAEGGLFADSADYRLTLVATDSSGSTSVKRYALVRVFY